MEIFWFSLKKNNESEFQFQCYSLYGKIIGDMLPILNYLLLVNRSLQKFSPSKFINVPMCLIMSIVKAYCLLHLHLRLVGSKLSQNLYFIQSKSQTQNNLDAWDENIHTTQHNAHTHTHKLDSFYLNFSAERGVFELVLIKQIFS